MFSEAWSCFTHPPLEPSADRRRRRGEPIPLLLRGVAVAAADDAAGPTAVAAAALADRVAASARDIQVGAAGTTRAACTGAAPCL